jgi:hypothetical protein
MIKKAAYHHDKRLFFGLPSQKLIYFAGLFRVIHGTLSIGEIFASDENIIKLN